MLGLPRPRSRSYLFSCTVSLGLWYNLWFPVPTALRRAAPFVTPALHDPISVTEFAIYLYDSLIDHTSFYYEIPTDTTAGSARLSCTVTTLVGPG